MPKSPTRPTQYPSPQWARELPRGKPRHSCRGGRPRFVVVRTPPAPAPEWLKNRWCPSTSVMDKLAMMDTRGSSFRPWLSCELDFIHLSQFASKLIGSETHVLFRLKGGPCSPCRSPSPVSLESLPPSFPDRFGN